MRKVWFPIAFFYGLVICGNWFFEIVDIPSVMAGEELTPFNAAEAAMESFLLVLAAAATIVVVRRLLTRIRMLEGMYNLCSSCKAVHVKGRWIPLEEFLETDSEVSISHGLCDKCAEKLYPDMPELTGSRTGSD